MDFEQSTQRRRWTRAPFPQDDVQDEDVRRKLQLVARACANEVLKIGTAMKYPQNVILTAMVYVRRFLKSESAEDSDVSLIIVTALYLAAKVEEVPPDLSAGYELNQRGLNMEALCQKIANQTRSAEEWKKDAIRNEMSLLVGLNFDLLCFHPWRSAIGYVEELTRSGEEFTVEENAALEKAIWQRCIGCYQVGDLMFEYPPGFLGAVCTYGALRQSSKSDLIDKFLRVVENVIQEPEAKTTFVDKLKAVEEELEQGRTEEKTKDARRVYDEYLKHKRAKKN